MSFYLYCIQQNTASSLCLQWFAALVDQLVEFLMCFDSVIMFISIVDTSRLILITTCHWMNLQHNLSDVSLLIKVCTYQRHVCVPHILNQLHWLYFCIYYIRRDFNNNAISRHDGGHEWGAGAVAPPALKVVGRNGRENASLEWDWTDSAKYAYVEHAALCLK